jgi:hypothetical protein
MSGCEIIKTGDVSVRIMELARDAARKPAERGMPNFLCRGWDYLQGPVRLAL